MSEIKERTAFTFYRTFCEGVKTLPENEQLEFLWAVIDLALDNREPNENAFSALGRIFWRMIKPNIMADRRKFENGCKGGKYGHLGGAPSEKMKGNQNARKHPKTNPKTNPNVDVDVDVDVDDDVNVEVKERSARVRFMPPTFAELNEYIVSNFYQVDADSFYSHYEAIGWKVGKNPMKDWKAAVKSWHSREMKERKGKKSNEEQAEQDRIKDVLDAVASGLARARTPQEWQS